MRFWTQRATAWSVCAVLLFSIASPAQTRKERDRPKLVVVLVVDQMRADYVDKYGHQWSGGLRRLLAQGAWFRQAAYPYLITHTCAGHATISTGTFPATHGMIGNTWWDRDAGKTVTCTEDAQAQAISYGPAVKGGNSAARLLVPTFADELRAQGNGATRVVAFSLKARSAIMLAGHRADAVTWHDDKTGAWVTSSAYASAPIPFVSQFVKAHPVENDFGKTWTPALPAGAYLDSDSAAGARGPAGWSGTFPHPLRGLPTTEKPDAAFYAQWEASPFSDAYLASLAQAAVDSLGLGKGRGTDFLAISFSALDLVGHGYGPRSHEVQDLLVRFDRTIGALLEHLDRKVGVDNYVVALTADHGVAPIPEQMMGAGIDAGRFYTNDIVTRVEKALEPHLGPGPHVARMNDGNLYFAPDVYPRLAQNAAAMRDVLDAIRNIPGVVRVFRSEELRQRPPTDDPLARAASLSYFPGRSGDLIVLLKPYWIFSFTPKPGSSAGGTTHGTAYGYDQRVPLLLMGRGIRPGEYLHAATPADIAATMAFLCGITLARSDGRVLAEALSRSAASAAWPVTKAVPPPR